jgi:hypothetical protein
METIFPEGVGMTRDATSQYQPLIDAMRGLADDLLSLMQRTLKGDVVDDAIYLRAFGAKEGMVPQLQKLCGLVEEMQLLEKEIAPQSMQTDASAYEKELIAHYLQEYKLRTPSGDDGSLG